MSIEGGMHCKDGHPGQFKIEKMLLLKICTYIAPMLMCPWRKSGNRRNLGMSEGLKEKQGEEGHLLFIFTYMWYIIIFCKCITY